MSMSGPWLTERRRLLESLRTLTTPRTRPPQERSEDMRTGQNPTRVGMFRLQRILSSSQPVQPRLR